MKRYQLVKNFSYGEILYNIHEVYTDNKGRPNGVGVHPYKADGFIDEEDAIKSLEMIIEDIKTYGVLNHDIQNRLLGDLEYDPYEEDAVIDTFEYMKDNGC